MRKSILVALLVFMSMFTVAMILPETARATTLFVGGGGPGNYTTIQAAVDAANPGDTVYVYSGTYYENIWIDKNLTLVGENRDTTIVDGGHNESVIRAWFVDYVSISGFTVINGIGTFCGYEAGIEIKVAKVCRVFDNNAWFNDFNGIGAGCDDAFVANNNVSFNSVDGIDLLGADHAQVMNNTVIGNGYAGIESNYAKGNTIAGNTLMANRIGILLKRAENDTLRDNVMVGNGIVVYDYRPKYWNTHDIDTSNTVNGKPVYYWKFVSGGRIPADAGQVILANTTNVEVEGLDVSNASAGIQVAFSSGATIFNNMANWNRDAGIYIRDTSDSVIARNVASNGGVHAWKVLNVTIIGNEVKNGFGGISIWYSHGGNISFNSVRENHDGGRIAVRDSENVEVYGNEVVMNDAGWYTIDLNGCDNCSVVANNVSYNGILDDGIGLRIDNSENVTTHHNNFIENKKQVYDPEGHGWDAGYPFGGNYWSDYNGTDSCSGPNQDVCPDPDGLGDTPYSIPGGVAYDRYPLMSPVPLPEAPQTPSAPRNLTATRGIGQVVLTWDPPASEGGFPITHYVLYRGTSSGTETFLTQLGITTSYHDTGLVNGQTYYHRVSAKNFMGEGPLSAEVNATPASIPGPPRNLSALAGEKQVTLTWNPPVDDGGLPITNYSIYRSENPGQEVFLTDVGDVLMYNDTGVSNARIYYYKVSARNSLGEGPLSNEANAVPQGRPSPPLNLTATASNGVVVLTWSPPEDDGGSLITNYTIGRHIPLDGFPIEITVGRVYMYVDKDVVNGVTYHYGVLAVNSMGSSRPSNFVNATPMNRVPFCWISEPPSGGTLSGVRSIKGSASDIDGTVESVEIRIDSGTWIQADGTTPWSYLLNTTPLSDDNHTLYARSFDGENYSVETSITVAVDNTPPQPPDREASIFEQAWFWGMITAVISAAIILIILVRRSRNKEAQEEESGGRR